MLEGRCIIHNNPSDETVRKKKLFVYATTQSAKVLCVSSVHFCKIAQCHGHGDSHLELHVLVHK